MDFFKHPQALIDPGASVGAGTRVWAFAHIVKGATIGDNCNICDHTFIEGKVRIGNRVTIKCGVYLWDGITLEDDVFVGPSVAFTNDLLPRSKRYGRPFPQTFVRRGASIGANATILPDLTIGAWAMVGAGAVVTKSVSAFAVVVGNPARFVAWICSCGLKLKVGEQARIRCGCGREYQLGPGRTTIELLHDNQRL